jgi:dipeptidyl aminopeptidase/acylaminoacyl peptidase
MKLSPGTRLGPYEIIAPLGAGGMGEVYRARDTRLRRDVAVKVLPPTYASDSERLKRFEHEARAAGSLNHPNILVVFDIGTHEGAPFLVTELLEGETLRALLLRGPLPVRRALEIGREIARGLSAAHARGIVHRDLKPENVFLSRDGRVKILDFGIAKLIRAEADSIAETTMTESLTGAGVILGTVGYVAPEQVRGEAADSRADLFAFGCVLYEMLTGKRAFKGTGTVDTLHAILHQEPAPIIDLRPEISPAVTALVLHCLEKDPELRFQGARDMAFALEGVAAASGGMGSRRETAAGWSPRRLAWIAAGAALTLAAAGSIAIALRAGDRPAPSFERLTFRRGNLSSARFSPDGVTVVYSAAWDGDPLRTYSTRLDSHESSPLALPDARLLAVSATGNLAITIGPGKSYAAGSHTTLATVPLAGGAPREVSEGIAEADWSPDGGGLAVVRFFSDHSTLEFPVGTEILAPTTGIICPRVSPDGKLVAYVDLDSRSDFNRGYVAVVDRAGHMRRLTGLWETIQGIAWAPRGDEVWFTGVHRGNAKELWAVSLRGRERLLLRTPGGITLLDVSRDGRTLLSQDSWRLSMLALAPGESRERDLSWQDVTGVADLSADGKKLVFTEYSEAYGQQPAIGMRGTDGSQVVHLGDGYAGGLSPDGKWVVGLVYGSPHHISLLPTGPGQVRNLDPGPVRDFDWTDWGTDSQHVLFGGIEPGRAARAYVQDITGGPPRAFTPEGVHGIWHMVFPDGKSLLAEVRDSLFLFPIEGGAPRYVPFLQLSRENDSLIRWLPDGKSALVASARNVLPVHIDQVNIESGKRRRVRDLMPQDPAGVSEIIQIVCTPDLRAWAYSYRRILSDLYVVKGLD